MGKVRGIECLRTVTNGDENPKLHDMLGRIEVMLKLEMDAPEFDRERVKAEIMAIPTRRNRKSYVASRRLRPLQKRYR